MRERLDLLAGQLAAAYLAALADLDVSRETNGDVSRETQAPAVDGRRAKIYIHGTIGGWRQPSDRVVQTIHGLDVDHIDLHVNSPGGYVFDAVSIYGALLDHPARVTAHIDGLAASAASFLVQAADEIITSRPSRMMIHDAQGIAWGNAAKMRAEADVLNSLSTSIAEIYADRAGGTVAAWRQRMQANQGEGTWYTADEAASVGLADRVSTPAPRRQDPTSQDQLIRARARALREGS